jgi:hypothetical protein
LEDGKSGGEDGEEETVAEAGPVDGIGETVEEEDGEEEETGQM